MRVCRTLLAIVLLLHVAFPAAAVVQNVEYADSSCATDMTTNGCFSDPAPTASGANYLTCTAKGTLNQGCYHLTEITVNGQKVWSCGKHENAGACSCDSATRKVSGSCTYYR